MRKHMRIPNRDNDKANKGFGDILVDNVFRTNIRRNKGFYVTTLIRHSCLFSDLFGVDSPSVPFFITGVH